MTDTKDAFSHVPHGAGGSFVIYLYAAIFRLMKQVRRLGEADGTSLEKVFERFPFLGEYYMEMTDQMPEGTSWDEGDRWWQREIRAWEARSETHLPLRSLGADAGLDLPSVLAFMVIGLVEEDSRFGTLFAELQEPLGYRRPTLELVGQMMIDQAEVGSEDPWSVCRPLLSLGLAEAANRESPRSEWPLRVPSLVWDAARGEIEARPAPWCRYREPSSLPLFAELIADETLVRRLENLPALADAGVARLLVLRGVQGNNAEEVMGAVARALGRGLIAVDTTAVEGEELALGALCTMTRSMPLFSFDLAPGETGRLPPLKGYDGPVGIAMGLEGGLAGPLAERSVTLNLATPGRMLRERFWQRALGARRVADLDAIVDRFHLPGDYIGQVAEIAVAQAGLEGRETITLDDVRRAGGSLNRQLLDTLADPVRVEGDWSGLVAGELTTDKLLELERRCRYRERLGENLGPAFGRGPNSGVRALFTGGSGTGKTMAAGILAAELGMDLYRVDLAAVINKYIGETEKNLHRVLSRAEVLDVILLLDEGDALLGQRTDVRSANDRYANLETNYLLQRLESYRGIVVITTNLVENVDRAFQRRMDVVVPFFPPEAPERLRIMELHLPPDHRASPTYLEEVALRCVLSGGQIRSSALHAALLALDQGGPVEDYHLQEALRSEYRKAGATFPLQPLRGGVDDGGMDEFVAALGRQ